MFHKYRSSHPKEFCKNHVLNVSQNSQESTCVGVSFLKNSGRQIKGDFDIGVSCEFLRTLILKNICKWLLTNLFYENKPPVSKGKKI